MEKLLNESTRNFIEDFAEKKRYEYELGLDSLGDGIIQLLNELNINLVFYPKHPTTEEKPFSAMYLSSIESNETEVSFIGVNTARYYDVQIFSIAHELYHHFEKNEKFHLFHNNEQDLNLREQKANYFAAAFLLPEKTLKKEIFERNNYKLSLNEWELKPLLRFVAKLHLDYKLPYRSIIFRLIEVGALNNSNLIEEMLNQDTRSEDSLYYRIGISYDENMFSLLNNKTEKIGASNAILESVIRNFENSYISIDEFAEDLSLFNKKLEDYGWGEEDTHVMEVGNKELAEEHDS